MRLKKLAAVLMAVTMVMTIQACGKSENTTQKQNTENVKLDAKSARIDGSIIKIDDNIKDVMKKIGETQDVEQAKSCLYNGYDKAYKYDDCTIRTYPDGDDDYVNSIEIYSSEIGIEKAVHVGDTIETVKKVYGDNPAFDTDTYSAYEDEEYGVAFYYENEKVNEIEIYKIEK